MIAQNDRQKDTCWGSQNVVTGDGESECDDRRQGTRMMRGDGEPKCDERRWGARPMGSDGSQNMIR